MNGRTNWIAVGLLFVTLFRWPVIAAMNDGHFTPRLTASSLIGVDNLETDNLQYCEGSGHCYTYSRQKVEALLTPTALDSLPRVDMSFPVTALRTRRKRSADQNEGGIETLDGGNVGQFRNEAVCCASNISIFFPSFGISATTNELVPILQITPFRQSVIYNRCLHNDCRILRGNCTQIFLPQLMYILTVDSEGNLTTKRDFILVESGCQCQTDWRAQRLHMSSFIGVNPQLSSALHFILGVDVSFQNVHFLANSNPPDTTSKLPVLTTKIPTLKTVMASEAFSTTLFPSFFNNATSPLNATSKPAMIQSNSTLPPSNSILVSINSSLGVGNSTTQAPVMGSTITSQITTESNTTNLTTKPTNNLVTNSTTNPVNNLVTNSTTKSVTSEPMFTTSLAGSSNVPSKSPTSTTATPWTSTEQWTTQGIDESLSTLPPLPNLPRPGLPVQLNGFHDPVMSAIKPFIVKQGVVH